MQAKGKYYLIPQADYPQLDQAAVILRASSKKRLAEQFLDFIKKPTSLEVMKKYGFAMPDGDKR